MPLETIIFHPFTLSLSLSLAVFLLIKLVINGVWSQKLNLPPSPPKLPVIGNLHQLGTLVHHSFRQLSQQFGPLMLLHLGSRPTVVVSSAEMAREVLKTHELAFTSRAITTGAKIIFYGGTDVGFAPYGEYWRQVKKFCVIELLSNKRVKSFKFVREEEVALVMQNISASAAVGATINLSEILLTLTNDIVCRCALGRKHECGDGKSKFGVLSRELLHHLVLFSFGDLFPWLGWMDVLTGLVRRIKNASAELDAFFDEIIDEHVLQMENRDPEDSKDFVDLLLHVQQNDILGIKFTRDNLKAIILDMIAGGTDTTGIAIEWAIAELVKNPSKMKKVQEEVRRVVGRKAKVDEEDIQQMTFLSLVIKETLRLHPSAALMPPRVSTTPTTLKGFDIPSNTRVVINAWAIQRDPEVWHNPEEFILERFDNNPIDFKGQHYEFIPFGAGRRFCPGISFGMAVTELILANLLYCFDWELPDGANKEELDMNEAFGFVFHKKIPLRLVPVSHYS